MATDSGAATETEQETETSRRSRPPRLAPLLLTDLAGVLAALTLFGAADLWYQLTAMPLAGIVSVANALFVGYLLTALIHEWGHYAGARAGGAATTLIKPRGFGLFRFRFNFEHSSAPQFKWMSIGGNVAHWSAVLLLLWAVPLETPAQLALVAAAFGFAVSATIFELPVLQQVRRGADPQQSLLQRATRETFRRGRLYAAAAGALLFAVLS